MSAPFNFGSQNTAPQFGSGANLPFGTPTTNQFGFGATSQPNANFSLGTTNANILGTSATANTSGLNFKPATAPTALGFGTATSTPNTGFSFGATPTAATGASGFGLGAQNPGFGAPALSTANTGFGLANTTATATSAGFWPNTSTTTTSANMFGSPATTGANLSFGTPASTAPSLGFGTTLGGGGLSFNAPTPPTTSGIGFSGGIPSSSAAPPTGLSFGLSTPTNIGFGQAASTAASTLPAFGTTPMSSGFGFGSAGTTTPATNLTFSTPSAAPTLNFGATATPTAASAASLSFGATPTPNFGATATPAATSAAGLNFANPAASTGLSFGLKTTAAATTTQKVGLGGIATTVQSTLGTSLPTTVKEVPPREQQIPNEIQQDVENFKNFIKQQKLYSSDVARCSVKDFREVESQITLLNNVIKEVESQLQRNRSLTEKLKYDTAQGLQLLEMAQRTQDTPPGLQYENVAPLNFFLNLADSFEKEMHNLKLQIENTDKYVRNFGQPATLTSQDLYTGMKRLHDTFVALAGRLQSVHSQVESQKEFYINLRKHLTHDMSNPFEKLNQKITSNQSAITQLTMRSPPKIACGPSPFNNIINTTSFPISTQQQNQPPPPYPGTSTGVGGFNLGSQGTFGLQTTPANASLFDNNNASLKAQNFQLQKPPTGNKRGKQ